MKVEIKVSAEAKEPYAVIYTDEVTAYVRQIAEMLESAAASKMVTVADNERIMVLRPEELYMIRIENEKTVVYTKTRRYISGKRLYEFEALVGNGFMRISRSTVVNLNELECVEPTFGGLMLLRLKNGCKDYISRKYLPVFKKYLGL